MRKNTSTLPRTVFSRLPSLKATINPVVAKEIEAKRSRRSLGGPGPHVFNFTCSATTGKAKNAPVLASKARLKRFASISFATTG